MEAQLLPHQTQVLDKQESYDYCLKILPHVSRSFSLGINLLKGDVQKSVLIGYLLCRIIDTIEDDLILKPEKKIDFLQLFLKCFDDEMKCFELDSIVTILNGDPYHLDLVNNTSKVFCIYNTLSEKSKISLRKWITEMSKGMAYFLNKQKNGIRIQSIHEYKEYCYYVAGTVGFLLTELWQEYGSGIQGKVYKDLYKISGIFGEALQTINILKDISWDAKNENSIYIPQDILNKYGSSHDEMLKPEFINRSESAVREMFTLAKEDLSIAIAYIKKIPKRNVRIRFFCIFPLLMAYATLRELDKSKSLLSSEKVIKVTRNEVEKIVRLSFISSLSNTILDRAKKIVFS